MNYKNCKIEKTNTTTNLYGNTTANVYGITGEIDKPYDQRPFLTSLNEVKKYINEHYDNVAYSIYKDHSLDSLDHSTWTTNELCSYLSNYTDNRHVLDQLIYKWVM